MTIYDRCSAHDEPGARVAQVTINRQLTNGNNDNNQRAFNIDYLPRRTIHATRQQKETNSAEGPINKLTIDSTFNFLTLYSTPAADNSN